MEKSDEKPLTKTFYLKTCLFNISYSNMDSSNFHIRKYFRNPKKSTPVRLEQSTSESLARHFNHWAAESVDIQCKWFLYNTKQQEVTGVIICKSNFSLEICSSECFHRTFPSDSYGRFFIELLALWMKLKVYLHDLVLAHTLSLLISWEHSSDRPRIRTHATQVDLLLYY